MQKPITLNHLSVEEVLLDYWSPAPTVDVIRMTFTDRLEFIHVLDDLSPESVLDGLKTITKELKKAIKKGEFLSQNVCPTCDKPFFPTCDDNDLSKKKR